MKVSQILYVTTVLVAALTVYCSAEDEDKKDKKKKLQIGVKKRVDPELCTIKSKKGDTLDMHYTVRCYRFYCRTYITKRMMYILKCDIALKGGLFNTTASVYIFQ